MFRFTDLIQKNQTIREIEQQFPQTKEIFEEFSVSESCRDCSLAPAAERRGINPEDWVNRLNTVLFGANS
ncbi:MAG: hypothetical protein V3T65_07850 [Acidobacteriota bacterium]